MSFKYFIYYCAVLGGWAALAAWAVNRLPALRDTHELLKTPAVAGLLAVLVAATVGGLDAVLNSSGKERAVRVMTSAGVALVGGALGGFLGQLLYNIVGLALLRVAGWVLVGVAIGASIGVYDVLRARQAGDTSDAPRRKVRNGVLGGFAGGLIGGLVADYLPRLISALPNSSVALGLVILGSSIGLLIGLAQVFLKEAWLKVETGFRAGREMILSKDETTVGRAESCDLGLFGDAAVDRLHARIRLKDRRYVVEDNGSQGGTYVNDQRVARPTPLKDGDLIRVGGSVLRFGERAKK